MESPKLLTCWSGVPSEGLASAPGFPLAWVHDLYLSLEALRLAFLKLLPPAQQRMGPAPSSFEHPAF